VGNVSMSAVAGLRSSVADVGGRPHWGKLHSLDAGRLRELYPRFGDFVRARDEADPAGRFTNPYLNRVLGPPPGTGSPADGTG
jgi:L-gulono-1,4-lactone dehydrogenase